MLLLAATSFLLGTMTAAVGSPTGPTSLVLRLEAYKSTVALYEPVTVTCRVKNPTTDAIKSNVSLDKIEFVITKPNGTTETWVAGRGDGILPEITHDPGSVMVSMADLGWKGKDSVFPVAGDYEVSARLYAGDRPNPVHIESNHLRIKVQQPSGVDATAVAYFSSEDEFRKLLRDGAARYCQGRDGRTCVDQLNQFIGQNGSSAYAPGVVWDLAAEVRSGLVDVQPRYDVAIGLYKQFLERWPDHPNAPKVMYGLAMTLDKAGRSGEAAEVILEFEKKFPEQKDMTRSLHANFQSGQMLPPKP